MENSKEIQEIVSSISKNLKDRYDELFEAKNNYVSKNIVRKINFTLASACEDEVARITSDILDNKYSILIDVYLSYKESSNDESNKIVNKSYRPDIVIIDTKEKNGEIVNRIVGIIEVKAQLGYSNDLKTENFYSKLNMLKKCKKGTIKFQDEEYKHLKVLMEKDVKLKRFYDSLGLIEENKCINYTIADDINLFVINVLAGNHMQNARKTIKNFENDKENRNIHFYSLFGKGAWYDRNIDREHLFGMDRDISKEKDNFIDQEIIQRHNLKSFINDIREIVKNT